MFQKHQDGVICELEARKEFNKFGWYTYDADSQFCPDDFVARCGDQMYSVSVKKANFERNVEGSMAIQLQSNPPHNVPFSKCHYDIVAGVSLELGKTFLIRKCDTNVETFITLRFNQDLRQAKGRHSNDPDIFFRPDWFTKQDFSLPLHVG